MMGVASVPINASVREVGQAMIVPFQYVPLNVLLVTFASLPILATAFLDTRESFVIELYVSKIVVMVPVLPQTLALALVDGSTFNAVRS